ncbi:MAG: hypothetical protein LBG58_08780 [Planctomycetaceae bacterium]|nr:hypothetical protein [Planctomycetaceae bacterium]
MEINEYPVNYRLTKAIKFLEKESRAPAAIMILVKNQEKIRTNNVW